MEMLIFEERGLPEYPEKTNDKLNPIYGIDAGIWTQATLVGGNPCSLKLIIT